MPRIIPGNLIFFFRTIRHFKFYFCIVIFLLSIMLAACTNKREVDTQEDDASGKPNIIVILADDLGWNDVSIHGSDIRTPHIDSLILSGMELTRFYAAPICSPTRAGVLTGKYPDRFGIRKQVIMPRVIGGLPPEEETLAELLKETGYDQRAAFGKWHLGHSDKKYHPLNQGFTSFYGHYNGAIDYFTHYRNGALDWHDGYAPSLDTGYSTDLITKKVIGFIQKQKNNQSFFAYVAFNGPHSPMQAKLDELNKYGYDSTVTTEDFPIGGAQTGEYNREGYGTRGRGNTLRQTYSGMVSSLDEGIGKILTAIREKGIEKNTVIWFMSDNGGVGRFGGDNTPLRGGKHTEWEGGVRVVAAVRWPDVIKAGTKSDQLAAYIDIVPTIYHIAGGAQDKKVDGINIMKTLLGEKMDDRFLFLGHDAGVTQKWKMIKGELFKIDKDMSETNNVADDYPEQVRQMEDQIEDLRNEVDKNIILELRDKDWRPAANWDY